MGRNRQTQRPALRGLTALQVKADSTPTALGTDKEVLVGVHFFRGNPYSSAGNSGLCWKKVRRRFMLFEG